MKHDDVFEVLEPPPHGLTRLRARLEERRAMRLAWPALLAVAALAVLVVLWPRSVTPGADLQTPLTQVTATPVGVQGRDGTGVEALRSENPRVIVYRAFASP